MDHSKSGDTEMNGGYDFNQLHLSLGCYIIYKSFCHFGHTFEKYLCLTKLKNKVCSYLHYHHPSIVG